jgi:L-2-hydroxyglutarate oxidase LhgO
VANKEPDIRAVAALYSPATGIIDSHAYMQQLCSDIISNGSHMLYRQTVTDISKSEKGFIVTINDGEQIHCNMLVNAAGLSAQDIAALITPAHCIPQRLLGKGHYFSYATKHPFQHLVYPLPQKNNSALGIHATLDMAGNMKFGPDLEYVDSIDYHFDNDKKAAFCTAIQRYYPQLDADKLQPDFTGIRPKIHTAATPVQNSVQDFVIQDATSHGITGLVNLFGLESPGLTASLAIGEYIKQQLLH